MRQREKEPKSEVEEEIEEEQEESEKQEETEESEEWQKKLEEEANNSSKKKNEFSIVQIPTQTALAFQTPEGKTISTEQLLVRIANDIREMRRNVG